jgi:hypothetical protein
MRRFACAMVAVLFTVAGCTKSDTVVVTGTVTINGQPAGDAEVVFTPQGPGRLAAAHTDSSGHFNLAGAKEGLVPGDYNVTLGEYYPPDKPPAPPKGGGFLPSRFPPKYADPGQSPLKAHVERGKTNDFKFDATK